MSRRSGGAGNRRLRPDLWVTRSLQVHRPDGNVLLTTGPEHRERGSRVPDDDVLASIEPAPDHRRSASELPVG